MEEAREVLERLERIEELERAGASPVTLLDELRALVRAAERWSERERDESATEAVDRCRRTLEAEGRTLVAG